MFGPSTRLSLPTAGSPHIFRERHTHRHPKKGAGSPRNWRHTPKNVGFFPPFLCLLAGVGACIAFFCPRVCVFALEARARWMDTCCAVLGLGFLCLHAHITGASGFDLGGWRWRAEVGLHCVAPFFLFLF